MDDENTKAHEPEIGSFGSLHFEDIQSDPVVHVSENSKLEVFKVLAKIKKCKELISKMPEKYTTKYQEDLAQATKDIEEIRTQVEKENITHEDLYLKKNYKYLNNKVVGKPGAQK